MTPAHGLSIAEMVPIAPASAPVAMITVETRLGPVAVHPNAILEMPQGPLGFARHTRFALADLPNPDLARFKLLQSMDDPAVTFVVAPVDADGGPIARADLDEAGSSVGLGSANLLVLLIVTVRNDPTGISLTANLRAPVLVDVNRRVARQVVLLNNSYAVRHPL